MCVCRVGLNKESKLILHDLSKQTSIQCMYTYDTIDLSSLWPGELECCFLTIDKIGGDNTVIPNSYVAK